MHTALEKKKHRRLSVDINDDEKKKKKNSLQPRGKKSGEEIVQRPWGELMPTKPHLVSLKENARLDA